MNRREFLSTLVGGVSVNAAVRTWPFRVFSFPSKIVIPTHRFSFFEMFALDGPEMSEFLPSELDLDLDAYMRSQTSLFALDELRHTLALIAKLQNVSLGVVAPDPGPSL